MAVIPKSYMTSDTLIQSAVRKAGLPRSQNVFTDDDFLAFANEEMDLGLVPSILSSREDYLMYTEDIAIDTNQTRYDIPARAIGNKLRDVSFVDTAGSIAEMSRIPVDYVSDYNSGYTYGRQAYIYYVENNQIVLVGTGSGLTPGFLRMTYYMRPNRLVLLNQVGIIQNIDTVNNSIVVNAVPSNFSTQLKYDFVSVTSPHKTIAKDLSPSVINPTTKVIQFTTLPTGINVGDHISISETTAIPQVPSDLQAVLAHRVAARCLEALGDQEGLQAANVKLAEYEQKTQTLIDDRVEASPEKIIARSGSLRRGRNSRRYRSWR